MEYINFVEYVNLFPNELIYYTKRALSKAGTLDKKSIWKALIQLLPKFK
jgi:hypothetical protein